MELWKLFSLHRIVMAAEMAENVECTALVD